MKKIVAALFFITSVTCYSQTIVIREDKLINLALHSLYLEDPDGKRTIEDILKPEVTGKFKKLDKPFINFGVTSSAFWIKYNLRNETDQKILIELGNATLTDIQLYEFDSSGLLAKHHSGNWQPFKVRHTNDVNYQFVLSAKPQVTETIFLRVLHYRGTQFPFVAGTQAAFLKKTSSRSLFEGVFYGFMLVMVLYNLFIYFSLRDSAYLYYVLYIFFMAYWNATLNGYAFKYIWQSIPSLSQYSEAVACLVGISSLLFAINFLQTKQNAPFIHKLLHVLLGLYVVDFIILVTGNFLIGTIILEILTLIVVLSLFVTAYLVLRRGYKPAGYFLLAWSLLLISVIIFILKDFNVFPYNSFTRHSMQIGSAIEALLLSMALANRINILKEEKEEAHMETLASLQENKRLITEQNIVLEKKVEERTHELKAMNKELLTAIQNLKETQAQLVQSEKMASLGELTAGIAHEIQNPLNFVNNFSEVNKELVEEMKSELKAGNHDEAILIADDIADNEQKINHHGKRADAIVKGMLQHSRASSGQKEPTDINALADEYLRLSYHGLRAKDKSFNATMNTDYDGSIGKINIIPQDIGRVILNLINNAFYAVTEKKKAPYPLKGGNYEPTVSVSTKMLDSPLGVGGKGRAIEIRVKDNGNGIPQKVLDKIFQPFFTTKPTGQGTGLGLSLAYDIIKAHGGEIKVETREGEGAEFIIQLH